MLVVGPVSTIVLSPSYLQLHLLTTFTGTWHPYEQSATEFMMRSTLLVSCLSMHNLTASQQILERLGISMRSLAIAANHGVSVSAVVSI